eukprot:TRINITY_DN25658_c0_g1_i1.p1 TRINITY_DN25658_c0_g1~~TRINITY_DN25658_c0_g1_i1.p1  ORF type:complete len:1190 (-),score=168.20 TRINITY_DN25658_c0_g1_i1:199-3768(-)
MNDEAGVVPNLPQIWLHPVHTNQAGTTAVAKIENFNKTVLKWEALYTMAEKILMDLMGGVCFPQSQQLFEAEWHGSVLNFSLPTTKDVLKVDVFLGEVVGLTASSGHAGFRPSVIVIAPGNIGKHCGVLSAGNSSSYMIEVWVFIVNGSEAKLQAVLAHMSSAGAIRGDLEAMFPLKREKAPLGLGSGCAILHAARRLPCESRASTPCVDVEPGSDVAAVKAIKSKVTVVQLVNEVATWAVCQNHPNVLKFLGLFLVDSEVFGFIDIDAATSRKSQSSSSKAKLRWALSMELHPMGDLCDYVRNKGPIEHEVAVRFIHGMLSGLGQIHSRGVIHRDVKAENVLLRSDLQPVICDFGIATFEKQPLAERTRGGSPGYAAPEVITGMQYGCKADIFGAGVVLHFALSSQLPFNAKELAETLHRTLHKKVTMKSKAYSSVRPEMKAFVISLVQKDPKARPSATQSLQMLDNSLARIGAGSNIVMQSFVKEPSLSEFKFAEVAIATISALRAGRLQRSRGREPVLSVERGGSSETAAPLENECAISTGTSNVFSCRNSFSCSDLAPWTHLGGLGSHVSEMSLATIPFDGESSGRLTGRSLCSLDSDNLSAYRLGRNTFSDRVSIVDDDSSRAFSETSEPPSRHTPQSDRGRGRMTPETRGWPARGGGSGLPSECGDQSDHYQSSMGSNDLEHHRNASPVWRRNGRITQSKDAMLINAVSPREHSGARVDLRGRNDSRNMHDFGDHQFDDGGSSSSFFPHPRSSAGSEIARSEDVDIDGSSIGCSEEISRTSFSERESVGGEIQRAAPPSGGKPFRDWTVDSSRHPSSEHPAYGPGHMEMSECAVTGGDSLSRVEPSFEGVFEDPRSRGDTFVGEDDNAQAIRFSGNSSSFEQVSQVQPVPRQKNRGARNRRNNVGGRGFNSRGGSASSGWSNAVSNSSNGNAHGQSGGKGRVGNVGDPIYNSSGPVSASGHGGSSGWNGGAWRGGQDGTHGGGCGQCGARGGGQRNSHGGVHLSGNGSHLGQSVQGGGCGGGCFDQNWMPVQFSPPSQSTTTSQSWHAHGNSGFSKQQWQPPEQMQQANSDQVFLDPSLWPQPPSARQEHRRVPRRGGFQRHNPSLYYGHQNQDIEGGQSEWDFTRAQNRHNGSVPVYRGTSRPGIVVPPAASSSSASFPSNTQPQPQPPIRDGGPARPEQRW